MSLPNSKFYRITSPAFSTQQASLGPFYKTAASPLPAQLNASASMPWFTTTLGGVAALVRAGRYAKWPGIYSPPQPARAWFTAPTFAAVTNHATFTLDDGSNPAAVFEFIKSGSPSGSNIPVTITGLTTDAQVAAAIVTAINAYTAGLGDIAGGWYATTPTTKAQNLVYLVQTGGLEPVSSQRSGWLARTYGMLGNTTITVGAGSGLTSVTDFSGGTSGASGVFGQFVLPGHRWALTESTYVAVPKGD